MNVKLVINDDLEWPMRLFRADDETVVLVTRTTHLGVAEAFMESMGTTERQLDAAST